MRRFVRVIILFCLTFISINSLAQVKVNQSVDSIEIRVGEQTKFILNVTIPKGAKLKWPLLRERQNLVPGLEIVYTTPADTISEDGALLNIRKVYTLTSFKENLYAIPPINVNVNHKLYSGTSCALKVITIEVDTLHPNQFFPPKGVQDNPFLWSEIALYLWLSIFIVILSILTCYLIMRLRQNKPIVTKIRIIKYVPPHKKALITIDQIKKDQMQSNGDQKKYYTQLTDTLRQYIQERFGFSAKEMTSNEIIACLQKIGDEPMINELRDLFITADLVKFAKYSTLLNENDLHLVKAIDFIDKTKLEGQPVEERIVPSLLEDEKKLQQNRIMIKISIWCCGLAILGLLAYVLSNVYLLFI